MLGVLVEALVVEPMVAAVLDGVEVPADVVATGAVDAVNVGADVVFAAVLVVEVVFDLTRDEAVSRYVGVVSTGRRLVTLMTAGAAGVATEAAEEDAVDALPRAEERSDDRPPESV